MLPDRTRPTPMDERRTLSLQNGCTPDIRCPRRSVPPTTRTRALLPPVAFLGFGSCRTSARCKERQGVLRSAHLSCFVPRDERISPLPPPPHRRGGRRRDRRGNRCDLPVARAAAGAELQSGSAEQSPERWGCRPRFLPHGGRSHPAFIHGIPGRPSHGRGVRRGSVRRKPILRQLVPPFHRQPDGFRHPSVRPHVLPLELH